MFGLLPVFAVFFLNESLDRLDRWRNSVGLAAGTMLLAVCARRCLVVIPEGAEAPLFGADGLGGWYVGVVLDGPAADVLAFLETSAGLSRLARGGSTDSY